MPTCGNVDSRRPNLAECGLAQAKTGASRYNGRSFNLPNPKDLMTPFLTRFLMALLFSGFMASASFTVAAEQTVIDPAVQKILDTLGKTVTSLRAEDISPSPVAGLYEVMLGARMFYVSGDGRYIISGRMTDLESGRDLTETKVSAARKKAIGEVGEKNMVIYGPADAEHTLTVFTDIDCGYCRKLHSEMGDYNEEGIRIRYLFYPRAGVESESANKAVAVWCADDRQKAMTQAKQGEKIPLKKCDNPVEDHYLLGRMVGVTGTPALVLEDGELVPGYIPPKRLKKLLDEKKSQKGG